MMKMSDKLRSLTYSLERKIPGFYVWCGNFVLQFGGTKVKDEPFYPFVVPTSIGFGFVLPNGFSWKTTSQEFKRIEPRIDSIAAGVATPTATSSTISSTSSTMTIPSNYALESLEKRATDIIALAQQYDAESQATLSAKRRFFLVELDVAGLQSERITAQQVAEIQTAGYPNLATLLGYFRRLEEYSNSPERIQWNPISLPGRSNVPICFDWFIASTVPEDWDGRDFLSRCERIWSDQSPSGEGLLFTRIFDHRVKFVTGYEDGLRLVLCRVEVGERVNMPQLPRIMVTAIDLTRLMDAYDGTIDDWYALVKVPLGPRYRDFALAEIDSQYFSELEDILGAENFNQIVETQGYVVPQGEFAVYKGEDDLQLRYYTRAIEESETRELIIVSFGEFQPGRWIAHVEGVWHVIGVDF